MGGQEELLEIEAPWWATPSRRVQTIAVIACVLLLAGVVVALLQHQRPSHARTAPQLLPVPVGQPADAAIEHVHARCPAGATCHVTATVPDATSQAISDGLPGGTERAHYSVVRRNPEALFYRSVNATAGLVELLVIVSVAPRVHSGPVQATRFPPGATIGYVREYHRGFEVQVQFTGPPGYQAPMALAHEVAADPRLLVLS